MGQRRHAPRRGEELIRRFTLDVRGLPLVVWELSPPGAAGPVTLCLHGWLDQGLAFAPLAAGMPGRWLALDQRGHGQSGHLGAGGYYHFPDYLADLDALVGRLGAPVRLIGHSMGGTVSAMYAGTRPEAVSRLVIIEGLGAVEASDPSALSRARQFLDGLRAPPPPVRVGSIEEAAGRLLRRHDGLSAEQAALLALHGTSTEGGSLRWSFDSLHLTRAPIPFREEAFREFLEAITAPTLLLWGTESWYPPDVAARRGGWIPRARAEAIPGGHMLPHTAPALLAERIGAFFDEEVGAGPQTVMPPSTSMHLPVK